MLSDHDAALQLNDLARERLRVHQEQLARLKQLFQQPQPQQATLEPPSPRTVAQATAAPRAASNNADDASAPAPAPPTAAPTPAATAAPTPPVIAKPFVPFTSKPKTHRNFEHNLLDHFVEGEAKRPLRRAAPQQLLVLSPGDSGQSLVARLLMMMGIYGGERDEFYLHGSTANPHETWERKDLVKLNHLLLSKERYQVDTCTCAVVSVRVRAL